MAELTKVICKIERQEIDEGLSAQVVEEIADVQIMLNQLALVFGEEAVQSKIKEKMRRLADRLRDFL